MEPASTAARDALVIRVRGGRHVGALACAPRPLLDDDDGRVRAPPCSVSSRGGAAARPERWRRARSRAHQPRAGDRVRPAGGAPPLGHLGGRPSAAPAMSGLHAVARRVAAGTASNALGRLVVLLSRIVVTPIIVHAVGATDYGIWVLIGAIATFGGILELGIS